MNAPGRPRGSSLQRSGPVGATDAVSVVRAYWHLMASNDFESVRAVLADDYVLEWPQSWERIRGPANFVRMNADYPASGPWRFDVHRVVGSGGEAASDVGVTDGVVQARCLSFFTVRAGLIVHQVEFWPEPYPAPANRAHLVERMP